LRSTENEQNKNEKEIDGEVQIEGICAIANVSIFYETGNSAVVFKKYIASVHP